MKATLYVKRLDWALSNCMFSLDEILLFEEDSILPGAYHP